MADRCPDWPSEFGFPGGGLRAALDYQALLEGLAWGGYLGGRAGDQDAVVAEEAAAAADGRMRRADLAWVAAADRRVGVGADGCPARLCGDAVAQIALALTLTGHSAAGQADLAAGLGWRLTATRRALT